MSPRLPSLWHIAAIVAINFTAYFFQSFLLLLVIYFVALIILFIHHLITKLWRK